MNGAGEQEGIEGTKRGQQLFARGTGAYGGAILAAICGH